jgi:DME family drug/metabolite transporter
LEAPVLLGELAGIASAGLWACSSLIMADLSRRMPALAVSFLRLSVGLAFYLVLLFASGNLDGLLHVGWGKAVALGLSAIVAMGIGDTLYISGMHMIGVSKASPISVTSYPLLTVLLAWLLLGEVLSVAAILGTLLVVGGIVLVVVRPGSVPAMENLQESLEEGLPGADGDLVPVTAGSFDAAAARVAVKPARPARVAAPELSWLGVGLVLVAAVTWACSTIWLRQLTTDTNLIVVNSVRVPIAALFLGTLAASRGALDLRKYRPRDLWLLVGAGLVGSGIGSLLYVYALREAGAGRSAILNSLSPVFALPLAAWLLRERVTKLTIAGTLLALVGVWLVIT